MSNETASEIASENDVDRCIRKANQHWEMAGLAHHDGDLKDAERHTNLARAWDTRARELLCA